MCFDSVKREIIYCVSSNMKWTIRIPFPMREIAILAHCFDFDVVGDDVKTLKLPEFVYRIGKSFFCMCVSIARNRVKVIHRQTGYSRDETKRERGAIITFLHFVCARLYYIQRLALDLPNSNSYVHYCLLTIKLTYAHTHARIR